MHSWAKDLLFNKGGQYYGQLAVDILEKHPRLLLLPLLAAILSMVTLVVSLVAFIYSFTSILFLIGPLAGAVTSVPVTVVLVAVIVTAVAMFYLAMVLSVFVYELLQVDLVDNIYRYVEDKDISLAAGFKEALVRSHYVLSWSFLYAAVVLLIAAQRRRGNALSGIVTGAESSAWNAATVFSVPIIRFENLGAFAVLKRSAQILTEEWKQKIAGQLKAYRSNLMLIPIFGMLFIFIVMVALFQFTRNTVLVLGTIILSPIFILTFYVLNSSVSQILNTLLYLDVTGRLKRDQNVIKQPTV